MTMMKKFTGFAVACAIAAGSVVPQAAFSAPVRPVLSGVTGAPALDVTDVQYKRKKWGKKRYSKKRRSFSRRGDHAYYNGKRGYRKYRRGYRRHNGYWFPPEAFILGAIIGGAIASSPPRGGLPAKHYIWCDRRYKTYKAKNNSFQPKYGPRKKCVSPYWP